MSQRVSLDQPHTYRIRVQGALDVRWAEYFDGLEIQIESGADGSPVTILTGCVADQAAMQGTLQKLYTLGFPLLSVEKIDGGPL